MPFRLYQAVPLPDESSTAYADGFAGACGFGGTVLAVSYTHLTLPTNREV